MHLRGNSTHLTRFPCPIVAGLGGLQGCSTSSLHNQGQGRRAAKHVMKHRTGLRVRALDAAQPFDYESRMVAKMRKQNELKIGFVGFGTFGQFLARRFIKQGHEVIATSRTPYVKEAAQMGVTFYPNADDFCESHPDVVIFATSILSLETVMKKFPLQRLRRSTLIADVASVKAFPRHAMLRILPPELDILCTHPMFGPDSGDGVWNDLKFMYECVRIADNNPAQKRLDLFLNCFQSEGCTMVNMTCDEHDRLAAGTQFLTHTVGRVLGTMDIGPTSIDTKGYESLMSLVENTANDSFELYYGLFLYNPNAPEQLARLESALDDVKAKLFDRLHSKLRSQLFPDEELTQSSKGSTQLKVEALPPPSLLSSQNSYNSKSDSSKDNGNVAVLKQDVGSKNGSFQTDPATDINSSMLRNTSKDVA